MRATLDIDLWVRPTADNALRTWRALQRFRAPLSQMRSDDFAEPEVLYQIGVPPSRIDIMTSVTELNFDAAWPSRVIARFGMLKSLCSAWTTCGRQSELRDG